VRRRNVGAHRMRRTAAVVLKIGTPLRREGSGGVR
jgi:hypothetical protein